MNEKHLTNYMKDHFAGSVAAVESLVVARSLSFLVEFPGRLGKDFFWAVENSLERFLIYLDFALSTRAHRDRI
jgi:hypothetical protein